MPELNLPEIKFNTVADLLARMDGRTACKLVNEVLPSITILDPAVGSGAFLVAALKSLVNVYYAVVGRAEMGASAELQTWLRSIQQDHPSVGYYIKRRIVTDNLHGVDIMEEACEIAKLRLFLTMVASVRKVEDLEPLPNIDFNILPGNSLVGLMRVDAAALGLCVRRDHAEARRLRHHAWPTRRGKCSSPRPKNFLPSHSDRGHQEQKMTIKEFEKEQATLLQGQAEVRAAWMAYESRFPHLSQWSSRRHAGVQAASLRLLLSAK
jgi:hypothetical protein